MNKRILPIIIAALIVIASISSSFLDFASSLAQEAAGGGLRAYSGRTDAIVVLTGGRGRVDKGLNLLKKGNSGLLILSGVNIDADLDAIFQRAIEGRDRENIMLEKTSRSTYENAVEVRKIMKERGLKTMVLITSWYHMKRALYIFRSTMPKGFKIEPLIVGPQKAEELRWNDADNLMLIIPEFIKYGWYRARFGIEEADAR